jgi:hypothetical protein
MEVALKPKSFNRGWKAAPTQITPSLKLMTLIWHLQHLITVAEIGDSYLLE